MNILLLIGVLIVVSCMVRRRYRNNSPRPKVEVTSSEPKPCPRCRYTFGYADAPCSHCKVYR